MIYLREPNIIFIKPFKVASTSFEIALSKFAQDGDIITPVAEEEYRIGLGFPNAKNFKHDALSYVFFNQWGKHFRDRFKGRSKNLLAHSQIKYQSHDSANEIKKKIGPAIFKNATKISIVRNPFHQLLS